MADGFDRAQQAYDHATPAYLEDEDQPMTRYTVHLTATVSTSVEVDAEDPQEAIDAAFNVPGMPPGMTYQAFGDVSVDVSDWDAAEVMGESGASVWSERDERQR